MVVFIAWSKNYLPVHSWINFVKQLSKAHSVLPWELWRLDSWDLALNHHWTLGLGQYNQCSDLLIVWCLNQRILVVLHVLRFQELNMPGVTLKSEWKRNSFPCIVCFVFSSFLFELNCWINFLHCVLILNVSRIFFSIFFFNDGTRFCLLWVFFVSICAICLWGEKTQTVVVVWNRGDEQNVCSCCEP